MTEKSEFKIGRKECLSLKGAEHKSGEASFRQETPSSLLMASGREEKYFPRLFLSSTSSLFLNHILYLILKITILSVKLKCRFDRLVRPGAPGFNVAREVRQGSWRRENGGAEAEVDGGGGRRAAGGSGETWRGKVENHPEGSRL